MEGGTGYLVAGYLLTWAVLAAYTARILRRTTSAAARLTEMKRTEEAVREGKRAEQETPNRVG